MALYVIIALIVLGIFLLILELLVVPGITIAGISGLILIGAGIIASFYYLNNKTAFYILLGTVIIAIFSLAFALKTKTWSKMGLKEEISGIIDTVQNKVSIGDKGKTISRLAPIGKALINDQVYEVRSDGNYIDSNQEIIVSDINRNSILVTKT